MLLGEDGLPARLLGHVGFASRNFKLRPDEVEPLLGVDVLAIKLDYSLASVVISALLDVPDRRLGQEREDNGEERRDEKRHDEGESVAPFAVYLGRSPACDGGEEEAQDDDDVCQGAEGASERSGCVFGNVQWRRDGREANGEAQQELGDEEDRQTRGKDKCKGRRQGQHDGSP